MKKYILLGLLLTSLAFLGVDNARAEILVEMIHLELNENKDSYNILGSVSEKGYYSPTVTRNSKFFPGIESDKRFKLVLENDGDQEVNFLVTHFSEIVIFGKIKPKMKKEYMFVTQNLPKTPVRDNYLSAQIYVGDQHARGSIENVHFPIKTKLTIYKVKK